MSSLEAPIVLTSSSPLPLFARSPTPVEVLSPPRSHGEIKHDSPVPNGMQRTSFQTIKARRPGFTPTFTSGKAILGIRSSAENVPIHFDSPRLNPSCHSNLITAESPGALGRINNGTRRVEANIPQKDRETTTRSETENGTPKNDNNIIKVLPSDTRKKKMDTGLQSMLAKAMARKQQSVQKSTGFGKATAVGSMDSIANHDDRVWHETRSGDGETAKRRKIDLSGDSIPPSKSFVPARTHTKSPAKKGLTITALATSKYSESTLAPSPMAQYLVSTQARLQGDDGDLDTQGARATARSKKGGTKKLSKVVSPSLAQKRHDSQEFIFASASQLAREESPTTLKETLQAIRQSEADYDFLHSQHSAASHVDPLSPIDRTGLTRYQGKKGLWSAAERDENGALFQTDANMEQYPKSPANTDQSESGKATIFFDEPSDSISLLNKLNRDAAAVLFEVGNSISENDMPPPKKIAASSSASVCDSEQLVTTDTMYRQVRKFSTSQCPKLSKFHDQSNSCDPEAKAQQSDSQPVKRSPKQKPPAKPNYILWSDERLKQEVVDLGFKRLRARKSMINKLDEHYALQHGLDPDKVKAATKKAGQKSESLQQVDMLGKAHDLAQRPPPAKPRKPRKRKHESKVILANGDTLLDPFDLDAQPFSAFDRLENVDIQDSSKDAEEISDELTDSELPPSTAPCKGTGVNAGSASKSLPKPKRPPTLPQSPNSVRYSSPGFEQVIQKGTEMDISVSLQSDDQLGSIKERIQEAILAEPKENGKRNQQTNPTWHQKILMYDPIILEDLTIWLNTIGFNKIHEDREIDADAVKEWCHEHGICCLWKGGWRSNKKKAGNRE